jgi:hypothetical protein
MEIIGSEIGSDDSVLNVLPFGATEKHWNLKTQPKSVHSSSFSFTKKILIYTYMIGPVVIFFNECDHNSMQHYRKASFF